MPLIACHALHDTDESSKQMTHYPCKAACVPAWPVSSAEHTCCRELFADVDLVEAPMPKGRAGQSAFKLNSVGAQFRTQLRGLMGDLNVCAPHYIRCGHSCIRGSTLQVSLQHS